MNNDQAKVKIKRLLFSITFVLICLATFSQTLRLEKFTAKDGYLDETLYKVSVDSLGRLVLFSRTGISIYDGREFVTAQYPDHTFSMAADILIKPDNSIYVSEVKGLIQYRNSNLSYADFADSLFEFKEGGGMVSHGYPLLDADGNLYFWSSFLYYNSGNKFKSVAPNKFRGSKYSRYSDQLKNIYLEDSIGIYFINKGKITNSILKGKELKNYNIEKVFNSKRGLCFVVSTYLNQSTALYKIILFDTKSLSHRTLDISSNSIYNIIQGEKKLYFYSAGLLRTLGENDKVEEAHVIPDIKSIKLVSVIDDRWAMFSSMNSIILFDLSSNKIIDIIELSAPNMKIFSYAKDRENNVWLATDIGLYRLNIGNERIYKGNEFDNSNGKLAFIDGKNDRLFLKTKSENSKSFFELTKLQLQSNIYKSLGKFEGHVVFIIPKGDSTLIFMEKKYITSKVINGELQEWEVTEFDHDYLLSYGDTILKRKIQTCDSTGLPINFIKDLKRPSFSNAFRVDYPVVKFKNTYWLNSNYGPINIGAEINLFSINSEPPPAFSDRLYVFKNQLYFNSAKGLFVYDEALNKFKMTFRLPDPYSSKLNRGKIMKLQNDKLMFIDSLTSGYPRYIKVFEKGSLFKKVSIEGITGVKKYDLYQLFVFNDTAYFYLTRIGLYKFYESGNSFKAEKLTNILSQDLDFVNTQEKLGLFTKNGIDLFTINSHEKFLFSYENKGGGKSYLEEAVNRIVEPGKIYLMNNNKLTVYSTNSKIPVCKNINKTHLSSIFLESDDQSIKYYNTDSLVKQSLTIKYKTDVTIRFSSSCLSNGDLVTYKYSIPELDANWHEQKEPFIKLLSLQPGTYNFKITACNASGEWYPRPEILKIIITPPWYRSNLFYFIYVMLFGGLVFIFVKSRTRKLERQKETLEKTVKERTSEVVKQKEILAKQKHLIEEKHKEITDSINYAERIQRSFLATRELLDEYLKEYFVLFKPKDVVSGDFYWASKLNSGDFAFVTADSTGHGVPGAIMSLLNITSLEKAIETEVDPDRILNHTRKTIIERLKKDGSVEGGKDGMDCTLISLNKEKTKLKIAAAHNPIWIMRGDEVIEIKADKMPVGKHDKQNIPFTLHEIDLLKGDVIYTLSDGFPDQFGGPTGKKFMSKRLRELLQALSKKPMNEQKAILENTFNEWIGDLEQVDDVCVIGIRI